MSAFPLRILTPGVLLLAVGGAALADEPKPADGDGKSAFRTEKVKRDALKATVNATGSVEPEEVIDIGSQVTGQILKFGPADPTKPDGPTVDYCTPVKKGQVLAEIDPRIYKAQLAKMEAALKVAEAALDQTRSQNAGPAAVKVAEAGVNLAKANLDEAQLNLDYCTITAPVDGIIVDRRANVGQTTVSSLSAASLFLLAKDLSKMQVWASVNEADIGNIQVGQDATYSVDARPGKVYHGTVSQIRLNATVTENVVTYTVVVNTENPPLGARTKNGKGQAGPAAVERELLPYLTANVTFHVAERKDALLVPNAALRWRPQLAQVAPEFRDEYQESLRKKGGAQQRSGGVVWVQDNDFVRPIRVAVGVSDGRRTEVEKVHDGDTLEEGTAVVVGEPQSGDVKKPLNPFAPPPTFRPQQPKKQDGQ
jgi:HlyD family secretion protein